MSLEEKLHEKYAGKTTPEHRAAFEAFAIVRMILEQYREIYGELLMSKEYMDNVGFVLDPTLYRDALASKSVAGQLRLAKAALQFLDEIAAVAKENR